MARILPEGELTPEWIERVQGDFKAFRDRHGLTLPQIARSMGEPYTEQVLAKFEFMHRNNTRDLANRDSITRAVNNYIDQYERGQAVPRPNGFIETRVATRMLAVIAKTIDVQGIGIIFADAGRGKTMTLEAAAQIYRNAILWRVRRTTRTAGGLMRQLASHLAIGQGSLFATQSKIINALTGSDRPLLIDEAHQLQIGAIELLRDLHDECHIPIILAGTAAINDACSDSSVFFGQMNRRIVARFDVTEEARNSNRSRPLHTADEIRRMWEGQKLRLTSDGANLLTDLANGLGLGGLGIVKQVLLLAGTLSIDKPIDAKLVRQILRTMHGRTEAARYIERISTPSHVVGVA